MLLSCLKKFSFGIFVSFYSCTLWASHKEPLAPKHSSMEIIDRPALVVVHASSEFDAAETAKSGIDAEIRKFKSQGLPVIYLVSKISQQGFDEWYTDDRSPDYLVYSVGGEHNLPLKTTEVTIIGGFFGNYDMHVGCHTLALRNTVDTYFRRQNQTAPLKIHLPVSAIYFWPEDVALKESFLQQSENPPAWLRQIQNMLFSSEYSSIDETELGRAFFMKERRIRVVNPFADPNGNAGSGVTVASPKEDQENPLAFVERGGKLVARDGHYEEAEPVTTTKYQFILSTSQGPSQRTVGKGSKQVNLIIEN